MQYSRFITQRSAARKPSAIRSLQKYLNAPGMISLGGGHPNPSTFPFKSMEFTLQDGSTIQVGDQDMQQALQYSQTSGLPQLTDWLKKLQQLEHLSHQTREKPLDFDICVGNGSQEVLSRAFEMLIDRDDSLLIESPAYVGSLAFLRPLGCNFVEIPIDPEGLDADMLSMKLDQWGKNPETRNKKKPTILYTVPCGGNPTGRNTSLKRRQQIYSIVKKHDLIILEDDPYYYLQFYPERIPSYFSMDTDGRVLRFDSFSKILSAGIRIGWVTGPRPLIDRIVLHAQSTILHVSGVSQMMTLKLLEKWGHDGFLNHVNNVKDFYQKKRDLFVHYADKHLHGLADWDIPEAGMFVWIRLKHIQDSAKLIQEKAVEKGVILVPGFEFLPDARPTNYVRASFSTATEQEIDQALGRLAALLRG